VIAVARELHWETLCLLLAWVFSSFSIVDILEKKSGVAFLNKNPF
jgi:hypothetical protein